MNKSYSVILLLSVCFCFFACDNDSNYDVPEMKKTTVSRESGDNSRIISFNAEGIVSQALQRRAAETRTAPSVPSDAIDMVESGYEAWNAQSGVSYYLPESATRDKQIQLKPNTDYYIAGTLKLSCYGSGGTVYVLPGGSIEIPASLNNCKIESWGTVSFPKNCFVDGWSSLINYNEGCTFDIQKMNCQGTLATKGSVIAGSFQVSGAAGKVTIDGDLDVDKEINLSNNALLSVDGAVNAVSLELNSTAAADFGGCVSVSGNTTATNQSIMELRSYLNTANIKMSSNARINLYDNTLVKCAGAIEFGNAQDKFFNKGTQYAVVSCADVIIHQDAIDRLSGGPIDLHARRITNYTGRELRWTANVIFDGSTYLAGNGCRPQFGTAPVAAEPEYVLNHIAEVLSPRPDRISATAIDFKDGNAFVSWHEYGDPFQGYIDILRLEDLAIHATLHSTDLDFNHIAVADNDIYVAGGNNASGAFYASVNYVDERSSIEIDMQKLEGASGNCIIRENGNVWVVSGQNGGLSVFPDYSYTPLAEAKYLIKYGDRIAVLAGIPETKVYEYSIEEGTLVKEYAVGSIAPENGKNAMTTDGETLYLSLGKNGMAAFKDGQKVGSYETDAAVNCVDVDDDFVYIANSTAGLTILRKSDLSVVKNYTLGGASANFVKKGADGFLYVAYGLKGVHVFGLSEL